MILNFHIAKQCEHYSVDIRVDDCKRRMRKRRYASLHAPVQLIHSRPEILFYDRPLRQHPSTFESLTSSTSAYIMFNCFEIRIRDTKQGNMSRKNRRG